MDGARPPTAANENLGTAECGPKTTEGNNNENQQQQVPCRRPRHDRLEDENHGNHPRHRNRHRPQQHRQQQDGLDVPGRYRQIAVSLSNCGAYHHYVGRRSKAIALYQQSCRVREDALRLEDKHAAAAVASVSLAMAMASAPDDVTEAIAMDVDVENKTTDTDSTTTTTTTNKETEHEHQKLLEELRKTCTAEHRKGIETWSTTVAEMEATLHLQAQMYLRSRQGRRAASDTTTASGDSEPRLTITPTHQQLDLIETNYGYDYARYEEGGRARPSSATSPSTMRTFLEDEQYGWDLGTEPLLIDPYSPADAPRLDRESLLAMSSARSTSGAGTCTDTTARTASTTRSTTGTAKQQQSQPQPQPQPQPEHQSVPSITALRRSLDQERDYLDSCRTLFNMGILHLDNGSDQQALDILQMALTVLPSRSDAALRCHVLNHLALAQARVGNEGGALSSLDDALQLKREEPGSSGSRGRSGAFHSNRKRRIDGATTPTDANSAPSTIADANPNPNAPSEKILHLSAPTDGPFPSPIDASACFTNTLALLSRAHRSVGNWSNATRMATECLRARAARQSFNCNYPTSVANADSMTSDSPSEIASLASPKDLIVVTGRLGQQQRHSLELAHPDVACSYYNLGIILAERGRAELAMQYLDAFVDWVGHNFSCQSWHSPSADTLAPSIILDHDVSIQLCIALETVARLHLSLTVSVTRALQALKLSLVLRRTYHHPAQGADAGRTLHQLGLVHADIGTTRDSIACFREAAHIFRCLEGADHPDVAAVLCDEGHLHNERGELDEALFCYGEALRIARQNLVALQIGQFRYPYVILENDAAVGVIELLEVIGNILLDRHEPARAMVAFSEAERMSIFYHFPTTSDRRSNPALYSCGNNLLLDSSNPGAPAA